MNRKLEKELLNWKMQKDHLVASALFFQVFPATEKELIAHSPFEDLLRRLPLK